MQETSLPYPFSTKDQWWLLLLPHIFQYLWQPTAKDPGVSQLGAPLWTWIQLALNRMMPHDICKEEFQQCAISRKNHDYSLLR